MTRFIFAVLAVAFAAGASPAEAQRGKGHARECVYQRTISPLGDVIFGLRNGDRACRYEGRRQAGAWYEIGRDRSGNRVYERATRTRDGRVFVERARRDRNGRLSVFDAGFPRGSGHPGQVGLDVAGRVLGSGHPGHIGLDVADRVTPPQARVGLDRARQAIGGGGPGARRAGPLGIPLPRGGDDDADDRRRGGRGIFGR